MSYIHPRKKSPRIDTSRCEPLPYVLCYYLREEPEREVTEQTEVVEASFTVIQSAPFGPRTSDQNMTDSCRLIDRIQSLNQQRLEKVEGAHEDMLVAILELKYEVQLPWETLWETRFQVGA